MNTDVINAEFEKMINTKAIHNKLGVKNSLVTSLRYNLKNSINIRIDKKLQLLQKSGWIQSDINYTQKDIVAAIRFALNASIAGKEQGAEYLAEKFLNKRK